VCGTRGRLPVDATDRVGGGATTTAPGASSLGPAAQGRIRVLRDERVTLGSPNNRAGAHLVDQRLVTATVLPTAVAAQQGKGSVVYQILTDRWDLDAATVVQWYVWRWQIELFFLWLKQRLRVRVLGTSANAVLLSVYLAFLVHLVCLRAAQALGLPGRSPLLLATVAAVLLTLPASAFPAGRERQGVLPFPEPDAVYCT